MNTSNEPCPVKGEVCKKRACYEGYKILHIAFTLLPILAGLDKFFNVLTRWERYLSSPFDLFGNPHTTMMVVGIIEIIVGIGVWVKPKIFANVVAVWLLAIIVNLVLGSYYDIALRDFILLLGALALGRMSMTCDHTRCDHDIRCDHNARCDNPDKR